MDTYNIPRLYGANKSPKILIRKHLKSFVKVEQVHDKELTPAEEFVLYLLRMYPGKFSKSQEYYAEMMGVDVSNISDYIDRLEVKGYLKKHKKEFGRSKWYELLKEPTTGWYKVPKVLLKDNSLKWKSRHFNIKLCNLVLDDVNEIHFKDHEITSRLSISKGTFIRNRNRLVHVGIIEKRLSTKKFKKIGYIVDVHALLGMQEPGMSFD